MARMRHTMPSPKERLGLAAVEAMASALPALLSNKPALCDSEQHVNGIFHVALAVAEIAAALKLMAEQPDAQPRSLGASQATDVQRHYCLEVGPECYLIVWKDESRKLSPREF
jgi:hypothetical protein